MFNLLWVELPLIEFTPVSAFPLHLAGDAITSSPHF